MQEEVNLFEKFLKKQISENIFLKHTKKVNEKRN